VQRPCSPSLYAARAATLPKSANPPVRADDFITTLGGFSPNQFKEVRLPTLAELDAAVPDHPVYISVGFTGPSVTNTVGKAFFEKRGAAGRAGPGRGRRVDRGRPWPPAAIADRPGDTGAAAHHDLRRPQARRAGRDGLRGQPRRDHAPRPGGAAGNGHIRRHLGQRGQLHDAPAVPRCVRRKAPA
jgi:hypothetical protein